MVITIMEILMAYTTSTGTHISSIVSIGPVGDNIRETRDSEIVVSS